MAFFQLKIELPYKTAMFHWDICAKGLKSGLQDVFIPAFIAALVTILQVWKPCISINLCIDWEIYTTYNRILFGSKMRERLSVVQPRTLRTLYKVNKCIISGLILHGTYVSWLRPSNSQKQKGKLWLPCNDWKRKWGVTVRWVRSCQGI